MKPHPENSACRPNIVLIMADDMGFADIGCYGSEIETPHLDSLAHEGVRFSQMYNCARCCPSRASFLTGLYPHQAGIGHMVSDIGLPGYRGFLNRNCITIAEALREGGYHTHMAGKWHVGGYYPLSLRGRWNVGDEKHPRPIDRGFDSHFGTMGGAGSYFNPHALIRNDTFVDIEQDEFYYTDEISRYAVRVIETEASSDDPFFLYVAFTAPHWPLHALPEDIEKYRGKYGRGWDSIRTTRHETMKGYGIIDPKWEISPRDQDAPPWNDLSTQDWEDARMAVYAAQIDRMDRGIGRILNALRSNGMEHHTLVIFLADNGGCAEFLMEDGHPEYIDPLTRDGKEVRGGNIMEILPGPATTYMSYGLPWANVSNAPFRLFKHWVHEGGISTPLIARLPGTTKKRHICHQPAHIIDLMATFLDLSSVPYPKEYHDRPITPLEGESLMSALRGEDWVRQAPICWEHEGNRAVRQNQWKLVSKYPGEWELYDMENDRTELTNLAGRYPEIVRELEHLYNCWAERVGAVPWDRIREMKSDEFLGR